MSLESREELVKEEKIKKREKRAWMTAKEKRILTY